MEINGVAHTFITAGDFAFRPRGFYAQLLPFLGLKVVANTINTFYCVGSHTGLPEYMHPARNLPASVSGRARSDCITIVFGRASAPISTRRTSS